MKTALGGVIAILRGVTPGEVLGIGRALVEGGIRVIEVPLNSPQPFDSIERLAREFGHEVLVGAGTVLTAGDVDRVADAGARLILLGPAVFKAWRSVFPAATPMFAVGGVGEHNLLAFKQAGATGAGIGSSLYAPGATPDQLVPRAQRLVALW
jgi:2-dehydro-3-deoxyphosphogalactonate aldolase